MIVKSINEDILNSNFKHIAFAINKEGYNDSGFAGMISSKFWKELKTCGEHELGTVLSKKVGEKTFHALVCHSLKNGWGENQREIIKECFDNIPTDEPVATIAIGTGLIGLMSGADFSQIVCGMHDSNKYIQLHSQYTLESIMDICKKNHKTKGLTDAIGNGVIDENLVEYSALENNISTLDEAISVLKEFRNRGINNIYIDFNGHKLYSKNINTHKAYMLVTGMSKKDWLLYLKSETQKGKKQIEEASKHAVDNLEYVIEEGKKYIYEEKYDLWKDYCEADCKGMYHLYNAECALEIMKFIDKNGSIEEAIELMNNQGHSGYSMSLTMNIIVNFCKKGPEIYRYKYSDKMTDKLNKELEEIEKNNRLFESNEKSMCLFPVGPKREHIDFEQGPVKKLVPNIK